jgi:hypothetical protein
MGKTKTIIFIEPIQLTQFFMPKIGVEKVVNDGEDYLEVFKEARKEIEAMARQAYPQHFEEVPEVSAISQMRGFIATEKTNGKETPEENFSLIDRINNATTAKELKGWHLLIKAEKKNPEKQAELQKAYDLKMEELTQKETA